MVKKIPLQNGMYALVDDEDFERANKYTWSAIKYKTTIQINTKIDGLTVSLKKFILNLSNNTMGDEKIITLDKNGLNVQKSNLQVLDAKKANIRNKSKRGSSSKYKGVSYHKLTKKWVVQIRANGKYLYGGLFENEDEAGLRYNELARELHGEEAFFNVIGIDNRGKIPHLEVTKSRRVNGKKSSSEFRGVTYCKRDNGFYAQVVSNGKTWRKFFRENEIEAAKAYDKKAYELHGDKAVLNFPELIGEYMTKLGR